MLGFTPSNGPNVGDAPNEMGDNLPVVSFGALEGSHQVLGGSAWWHVCVLLDHPAEVTQLACFGVNGGEGRLARGNTDHHSLTPMPVDLGTGFHAVQVACGETHTCALLQTGAVAWLHRRFCRRCKRCMRHDVAHEEARKHLKRLR